MSFPVTEFVVLDEREPPPSLIEGRLDIVGEGLNLYNSAFSSSVSPIGAGAGWFIADEDSRRDSTEEVKPEIPALTA